MKKIFIFLLLFFPTICFADITPSPIPLKIQTFNGATIGYPTQILVPNGTLIVTGSIVELDYGSGSGGAGTITSLTQGTGVTLTPNPITSSGTIAIGQAVATTSSPTFLNINLTGTATSPVVSASSAIQLGSDYYTNLPSQANINNGSFGITIDGGGSAIATGETVALVPMHYSGTINQITLLASGTQQYGILSVDVWKDTYANYAPTVVDTICPATKPSINANQNKYRDSSLAGWTTTFNMGDIFKFNVKNSGTATGVVVILDTTKN